jgi:hypothetical protein
MSVYVYLCERFNTLLSSFNKNLHSFHSTFNVFNAIKFHYKQLIIHKRLFVRITHVLLFIRIQIISFTWCHFVVILIIISFDNNLLWELGVIKEYFFFFPSWCSCRGYKLLNLGILVNEWGDLVKRNSHTVCDIGLQFVNGIWAVMKVSYYFFVKSQSLVCSQQRLIYVWITVLDDLSMCAIFNDIYINYS